LNPAHVAPADHPRLPIRHGRVQPRGALVGATIRVRFWRVPAADIPIGDDARIQWLYEHWQRIDDWVGEGHPHSG